MKPTARDYFYQAHNRMAEGNQAFLHMVATGMTRQHLTQLIETRPSVWSRFIAWLHMLPANPKSKE